MNIDMTKNSCFVERVMARDFVSRNVVMKPKTMLDRIHVRMMTLAHL